MIDIAAASLEQHSVEANRLRGLLAPRAEMAVRACQLMPYDYPQRQEACALADHLLNGLIVLHPASAERTSEDAICAGRWLVQRHRECTLRALLEAALLAEAEHTATAADRKPQKDIALPSARSDEARAAGLAGPHG